MNANKIIAAFKNIDFLTSHWKYVCGPNKERHVIGNPESKKLLFIAVCEIALTLKLFRGGLNLFSDTF